METFRIEVGAVHGIRPSHVVGAIASEAGIEGVHIGRVDIRENHSYVDLPEGMPRAIFKLLQKVLVAGRELKISKVSEKPPKPPKASTGTIRALPREGRSRDAAPRSDGAGKRLDRQRPDRKLTSRRNAPERSK